MKKYNEKAFAIELIVEYRKTRNPGLIKKYIKEDLDIESSISEISDYLSVVEDLEKIDYFIKNNHRLNEEEYEWGENNMS